MTQANLIAVAQPYLPEYAHALVCRTRIPIYETYVEVSGDCPG